MTDALMVGELPFPPRPDYLRHETTLTSWLTTTDHKRIAILYAITIISSSSWVGRQSRWYALSC